MQEAALSERAPFSTDANARSKVNDVSEAGGAKSAARAWAAEAAEREWKIVIEFSPESRKRALDLWPAPGADLEIMRRVKNLFDPGNVLNRGRLYRRI